MIDVLGPEKRRRRSVQEKIAIVQQSFEPGMTVSLVARQHGVAASQLFLWRKQYQEGSLTAVAAGEQVVPASELASAMKQIKELQRLLGKKTMENELLKEAVEYGRQKSGYCTCPCCRRMANKPRQSLPPDLTCATACHAPYPYCYRRSAHLWLS